MIFISIFFSLPISADVKNGTINVSFFDLAARPHELNKLKVSMYGYLAEDKSLFLYFNEYSYRMKGKEKLLVHESAEVRLGLNKLVGCSVRLIGTLNSLEVNSASSLNFMGILEVTEEPEFVSKSNLLDCMEKQKASKN